MIRFLQKESRLVKAFFIVIIGVSSVGMVLYLIPGFMSGGTVSSNDYAVIYPHWYSRYLASGLVVSVERVERLARQQLQRQRYPDNPMFLNLIERQVGQQLVQQEILLAEAARLGVRASDSDVANFLHQGQLGAVLFPNGNYIGDDRYADIVATQAHMSVAQFEEEIKNEIVLNRLRALITAPVTVADQDVRESYRKDNIKIKFDYAVLSSDDLRKTINPSDADLEAFFKKNAARYAHAVPEERSITYFAFTPEQLPGGVPQPSQQEIQQYFNAHPSDYQVPEESTSRHILISVPNAADAKTDAAAKAKAEDVLKQLQNGGKWDELAKKYSDDPGSKDKAGELGPAKRGTMVPEFDTAIFTQKLGDIKIVKSQFGYHIVQVESRQAAHAESLNEVLPTIQATLIRDKAAQAEDAYARTLTAEAMKDGLQKTAAAHHLEVVTSPMAGRTGVIAALPDSAQILAKAFEAKPTDPPQFAPTGEGYAIFQVASINPSHAPVFADYKSHVLDDFRDDRLQGLLELRLFELAAKVKADGGDLAKAAKEAGATVKTSDLVLQSGQVPDIGSVGQVAPQLFDLKVGELSGPIHAERNGVIAKIVDRQEPSADDIAKNLDSTRDGMLHQKQDEAFDLFASTVSNDYRKKNRIQLNAKMQGPQAPGM